MVSSAADWILGCLGGKITLERYVAASQATPGAWDEGSGSQGEAGEVALGARMPLPPSHDGTAEQHVRVAESELSYRPSR